MKSVRLEKILDLIPLKTQLVFDIGTDHGHLAIQAVEKRKVDKVYAVDNRSGPLKSAQRNILRAGLNQKIITELSDGLTFSEKLVSEPEALCVIAGLGSQTISQILIKDSSIIKSYILCSNTNPWQIREWINQNNFSLIYEDFFLENGHNYWLLKIEKNVPFSKIKEVFFGDFYWYKQNYDYQSYLQNSLTRLKKIASQSKQEKLNEEKIDAIEGYLKLWN